MLGESFIAVRDALPGWPNASTNLTRASLMWSTHMRTLISKDIQWAGPGNKRGTMPGQTCPWTRLRLPGSHSWILLGWTPCLGSQVLWLPVGKYMIWSKHRWAGDGGKLSCRPRSHLYRHSANKRLILESLYLEQDFSLICGQLSWSL